MPTAVSRPSSTRIEWIDVVKGIAISLVVFGHVMQGAVLAGTVPNGNFYIYSDAFVYSFHMPAFFLVSGLLSVRSLSGNKAHYLYDKALTIAWPYFVWSFLNLAIFSLFSGFYNHAHVGIVQGMMVCLWDTNGFWFLHTLFCVQVFALLCIWIPLEALLALSLVGFFFSGHAGVAVVDSFLFFLPFFMIGLVASSHLKSLANYLARHPFIWTVLLFTFQAVIIGMMPAHASFWSLILGLTGTLGLIAFALGVAGTPISHILGRLGAASLGIFLLHPFFQGATRALLHKVPALGGDVSVIIQIIAAIVGSAILYEIMIRTPLRLLFSLKSPKKAKTA